MTKTELVTAIHKVHDDIISLWEEARQKGYEDIEEFLCLMTPDDYPPNVYPNIKGPGTYITDKKEKLEKLLNDLERVRDVGKRMLDEKKRV